LLQLEGCAVFEAYMVIIELQWEVVVRTWC